VNGPARQVGAIVRTDILFRFRRTAAVVTMLVIAASVYFIVPDTGTGRTLMQISGRRVLYNSAAVALGTGMFCGLILSMLGYYLIGNSFRRDIVSRTGFVVASTPVTNARYLLGKFCGNVLYLASVMTACMLSAMVMFLIRGEGWLQPFVFLGTYAWIALPGIAFCSAVSLAFESLPFLSGRAGDVLYFFLWAAFLGFPAAMFESNGGAQWLAAFDITGIVPVIGQMQDQFHTTSMSIGSSTFDASLPPVLYPGLNWGWGMIGMRCSTLILPGALVGLASLWFHRFDPARIKLSIRHSRRNVLARINALLKPVTRSLQPLASLLQRRGNGTSFLNAVGADVLATLLLSPLTAVGIAVFSVLSLALDASSMQGGLLPALIVVLILALADLTPRDGASGMLSLLYTAPGLRTRYVLWKFVSALIITLLFALIPILRLSFSNPSAALSLAVGSGFIAGGAVGLGVLARSQKPFIAFFLMLLYISLNAPEAPVFNFAGFSGHTDPGVQLGYALATALLLFAGYARHKAALKKL
jgi:hypothetical protein